MSRKLGGRAGPAETVPVHFERRVLFLTHNLLTVARYVHVIVSESNLFSFEVPTAMSLFILIDCPGFKLDVTPRCEVRGIFNRPHQTVRGSRQFDLWPSAHGSMGGYKSFSTASAATAFEVRGITQIGQKTPYEESRQDTNMALSPMGAWA